MLRQIFLTASSLILLTSCDGSLPSFPSEFIYSVKNVDGSIECTQHKIVSNDPLKVDRGSFVNAEDCPTVFGFKDSDIGPVMNWIRNVQITAKERCK